MATTNPIPRPAPVPCGSCPYRTDVPSGVWEPVEYAKLPAYDEPTATQPFGMFMCHRVDGRICAGWAGCHDMAESLGVRLAVSTGTLTEDDAEALMDYTTTADLFPTGRAAAEHGMADVEHPSLPAIRTSEKIARRRTLRGETHRDA